MPRYACGSGLFAPSAVRGRRWSDGCVDVCGSGVGFPAVRGIHAVCSERRNPAKKRYAMRSLWFFISSSLSFWLTVCGLTCSPIQLLWLGRVPGNNPHSAAGALAGGCGAWLLRHHRCLPADQRYHTVLLYEGSLSWLTYWRGLLICGCRSMGVVFVGPGRQHHDDHPRSRRCRQVRPSVLCCESRIPCGSDQGMWWGLLYVGIGSRHRSRFAR